MKSESFTIERIEIRNFKRLHGVELCLPEKVSVILGGTGTGKTSVCEFIHYQLYGEAGIVLPNRNTEDILGSLTVRSGDEVFVVERSLKEGSESLSFRNAAGEEVPLGENSPGSYLCGLDEEAYGLISFFHHGYREEGEMPDLACLKKISRLNADTRAIYDEYDRAQRELFVYRNPDLVGTLDRIEKEEETLRQKLAARPLLEEELQKKTEEEESVQSRMEENEKRIVILKADIASHADEAKLFENKQNARSRNREILAMEKELRLQRFELSKTGMLERAELEELKEQYSDFSLAVTHLADTRDKSAQAKENLSYHEKLLPDAALPAQMKKDIDAILSDKKKLRFFRILAAVFAVLGAGAFAALYFLSFPLRDALLALAAGLVLGIAMLSLGHIFSSDRAALLAQNAAEDENALREEYEKLFAYEKSSELYREEVKSARQEEEAAEEKVQRIQKAIRNVVSRFGYAEENGDFMAICDSIIEENDAYYDLCDTVEKEKKEYEALLRTDVERESLSVSDEFLTLQKELDFLYKQNESLSHRREGIRVELAQARRLLPDPQEVPRRLEELAEKKKEASVGYAAASMAFALAKENRRNFEAALQKILADKINSKLKFLLQEGEEFGFDEDFHLCFLSHGAKVPMAGASGGLSELGFLSLRISLAQQIKEELPPLVFDDSFAFFDRSTFGSFFRVLREGAGQILVATSSGEIAAICGGENAILKI